MINIDKPWNTCAGKMGSGYLTVANWFATGFVLSSPFFIGHIFMGYNPATKQETDAMAYLSRLKKGCQTIYKRHLGVSSNGDSPKWMVYNGKFY